MQTEKPETFKTDQDNWVDDHGDFLYQFALLRLSNNNQLAEDMVQETFLSALKSQAKFKGKSSERTWFVSILKNKIVDHYRNNRQKLFEQTDFQNEEFIESGAQKGLWKEAFAPSDWADKGIEQKELAHVFSACIEDLPQNLAAVFTMRELDCMDTKTICKELSISSSNIWVMLHRARTALRSCLEQKWFK